MSIGEFYDANDVVVGQAVALFAPENTPLPDFSTLNYDDVFDLAPWFAYTLTVGTGVTAFTLSDGEGHTTTSLAKTSTSSNVESALNALNNGVDYTVTGSTGGPFAIQVSEYSKLTASTFTGGAGSLTGGLWTPCGATEQGWTFGADKTTQDINIEEQSTPVDTTVNTQSVTISGSLSEDITKTLALALNGLVTQTAATSDTGGYDEVNLTDDVLYYSVVLLASNGDDLHRLHYAPKFSQLSNSSTAFRRAAAQHLYPVSFQTLCKPGQISVINFTEGPTA